MTDDELEAMLGHAFGCHTSSRDRTSDYTVRTTVARFEQPDRLESGAVSLITDAETRVHFATDNGIVAVEDGDGVSRFDMLQICRLNRRSRPNNRECRRGFFEISFRRK